MILQNFIKERNNTLFSILIISSFLFIFSNVYYAFQTNSFNLCGVVLLILFISNILVRGLMSKVIFLSSFFINISLAVFLNQYYLKLNGKPFIGGGDDEFFYLSFLDLYKNNFSFVGKIEIFWYRYWFFLYLNYILVQFYDFFNLWNNDSLLLVVNNCLIGSISTVLIHKISIKVLDAKSAFYTVITALLFPYLIFNYATFWRDTYVLFLLLLSLYVSFGVRKRGFFSSTIGFLASMLNALGIRLETGLPSIVAFIYSSTVKKKGIRVLLFLLFIIAISLSYEFIFNRITTQMLYYTDNLKTTATVETGIGAYLARFDGTIIGVAAYSFITLFNPIPPFSNFSIVSIFTGVGFIYWYFLVVFAILGAFKYKQNLAFKYTSLILLGLFFIIIYNIHGSIRHRLAIMPIVIMYGNYYLVHTPKRYIFEIIKLISLSLFFMALLYFSLKGFLIS